MNAMPAPDAPRALHEKARVAGGDEQRSDLLRREVPLADEEPCLARNPGRAAVRDLLGDRVSRRHCRPSHHGLAVAPGDMRRCPGGIGNPHPALGWRVGEASEVERCPAPLLERGDPGPAALGVDPAPAGVGDPVFAHDVRGWLPDFPVDGNGYPHAERRDGFTQLLEGRRGRRERDNAFGTLRLDPAPGLGGVVAHGWRRGAEWRGRRAGTAGQTTAGADPEHPPSKHQHLHMRSLLAADRRHRRRAGISEEKKWPGTAPSGGVVGGSHRSSVWLRPQDASVGFVILLRPFRMIQTFRKYRAESRVFGL